MARPCGESRIVGRTNDRTEGRGARGGGSVAQDGAEDWERRVAGCATLDELGALVRGCVRCGLRAGCRGVVFGEGHERARLCLIGEGPGAREDELGRPFVGAAGQLLDRILDAAGFAREQVYISNVVLCRPPGNRVPADDEIAACRPHLERRLQLLDPGIVVLLGATALRAVVGGQARISRARGRWQRRDGRFVMATYHPAYLLRNPAAKKDAWTDFRMVSALYGRLYGGACGADA